MKKLAMFLLASVLCIAVLSGCGKEKEPETVYNDTSVYGTWSEDFFDSGYIFSEDGTGYDTFWNLSFTYTADGSEMRLAYDDEIWGVSVYRYTVSGDTLTMVRITDGDEEPEEFTYYRKSSTPSGGDRSTEGESEGEGEGSGEEGGEGEGDPGNEGNEEDTDF